MYFAKLADISVLRSELLASLSNMEHFITLRGAERPDDPWDGLSLCHYVGDDPRRVAEARRRVADALGIAPDHILMPRQVHGTDICVLDKSANDFETQASRVGDYEADAIITDCPGYCVGVSTADCVPVLLCSPRAVAAVHAGWRGVVAGIVPKVVAELRDRFGVDAVDMVAAIGPCIHVGAFEVGEEVAARFDERFVDRSQAKPHVNLPAAVEVQLRTCGVAQIDNTAPCTFTHPDILFSARRHTIKSGRIASCVMIC